MSTPTFHTMTFFTPRSTNELDSNFTNSYCHPLLINLTRNNPSLFREYITPNSFEYGLCPETLVALILTSCTMFIYLITFIVSLIGVLWERKNVHIQARSFSLMLANMISNLILVLLVTLRVIVSKKYYPCFILSITFMLYPPLLTLPSILRGCRLYFLYLLNLKKKKLFGMSQDNSSLEAIFNSVEMSSNNLSRRSSTADTIASSTLSTTNEFIIGKETNLNDILTRKDRILLKLYEFLSSNKFFITCYITIFIVHLVLWSILGGIELGIHNTTQSWVFMESGFFEAEHGCNIKPNLLILVGAQSVFYLLLGIVIIVLCILSDRDTYNIKREEFLSVIILTLSVIVYVILASIPTITTLVDYFIPYVLVFVLYVWLECIICVILPVFYSIRNRRMNIRNQNSSSDNFILLLLKDKKAHEIITDFARRSYCLEDILAWNDIQNFRKQRKRRKAAFDFIETYLVSSSPLELNLPLVRSTLNSLREQLEKLVDGEEPQVDFFDFIEFQCLQNMRDIIQRLQTKNEYISRKVVEFSK